MASGFSLLVPNALLVLHAWADALLVPQPQGARRLRYDVRAGAHLLLRVALVFVEAASLAVTL